MMKKVAEDGKGIVFEVKGFDHYLLNAIRRYALGRVPVLAIDKVIFYENNSAFWDEYIAHRIGLVPLITPENVPEDSEILFVLDVEGPKKVYSGDLVTDDKDVRPALDNIPLFTLKEGQRVKLEGIAKVGYGFKHAKFQPGIVSFGEQGEAYKMFVETFYQMPPQEIIKRACDQIVKDLNRF